jgi:hypothetical protein
MTTRGNRASMSLAQATAATCMVFPPVAEQRCEGDASAHGAAGENVAAMAELRMRAELAEQQLCDLKAALDDMKGQRDAWRDQAMRLRRSPQRGRSRSRGRDDDDADVC